MGDTASDGFIWEYVCCIAHRHDVIQPVGMKAPIPGQRTAPTGKQIWSTSVDQVVGNAGESRSTKLTIEVCSPRIVSFVSVNDVWEPELARLIGRGLHSG